jgi:hypothetical protein
MNAEQEMFGVVDSETSFLLAATPSLLSFAKSLADLKINKIRRGCVTNYCG